jgi:ParB family chromosome partitioning protein
MENKKRALGRGLEQLFNTENLDLNSFEKSVYETSSLDEVREISLDELRPNPYQPRKNFDEQALKELASSIKEHGVFQPIIVKKSIKGYEIIAGERRYRASKLAGLETVPAIVRDFSDEEMMEIALLENLQRENLNAIEEALAYKSMIDKLGLTQDELAVKVGKSRSHITNMLGLLRLPDEVKDMVTDKKLSMGHARMISKLEDESKMKEMADKIYTEGLSVRQTEDMSAKPSLEKKNKIVKKESSNEYKYVEDLFREKLDTKVKISDRKIEISFTSPADLNRILEVLDIKE